MSGQEEHHGSDASNKTQTRSGIITPASDNFLNASDGANSGLKKRKRDGNTMEDLLKDAFIVRVSKVDSSKKKKTAKRP
jgi:DNA replication regulator SLD3